ncbi:MAG: bifunctional homocysteine S-methyltransferase/methylenetetrahydrofolate reductase [Streptosporangiaceae bacterium]
MGNSFTDALGRRMLVCDGAMGTMLHAAGNSLDRALPELNISDPALVSTIHESYISAGVDVIQTNTFGASRLRLAAHGYADMVRDINAAGVRVAHEAKRTADRAVFVAGSVSPAVTVHQRRRVEAAHRVAAVREQVEALVDAEVDLVILETFGYLEELVEAAGAATEISDVPVVAQATFADDGNTLGGESPLEVARALGELPVAALGTNCTLGPQRTLAVVEALRTHTTLPVSALPNAGLPRRVDGRRFEYNVDGAYFARYARRLADAGVTLIGGCCGTTPTHLRAATAELTRVPVRSGPPAAHAEQPPTSPMVGGMVGSGGTAAERLADRRFVVAAQIVPPLGGVADEATHQVAGLRERGIDLVCVTTRQTPRAQLGSINLALHLQQRVGVETIATATTWDKTIMTLQADLLGAHALGVVNVVCETGNPPLLGDYPNADGIWEVDSIGLVDLLVGLNEGRDCNGLSLATKTSFHIGARFNPGAQDVEAEIARTRRKVQAGTQFLITRPVYDVDTLRRMIDALGDERVPIFASIVPLRSFAEADYLAHEVPDLRIPEATLATMEQAGQDGARVGLDVAIDLLRTARPLVDGVVLTPPGGDPAALDRLLGAI